MDSFGAHGASRRARSAGVRFFAAIALIGICLIPVGCAAATGDDSGDKVDPVAEIPVDPAYRTSAPEPYAWAEQPALIAHGMGGIDGKRVTNTLEAFQSNYESGYRIFEVDLVPTSDGVLVARHDWLAYMYEFLGQEVDNPNAVMNVDEFKTLPVHGALTPLTIDDVIALMRAYPDVWIMTDTKSSDPADTQSAMQQISDAIGEDTMLADRIIVQIYDPRMLPIVQGQFGFENVLFTLYQLEVPRDEALQFAADNGVKVVGVPIESWTPEYAEAVLSRGLIAGVYTVNEPQSAQAARDLGAVLLWSDFLAPADLTR